METGLPPTSGRLRAVSMRFDRFFFEGRLAHSGGHSFTSLSSDTKGAHQLGGPFLLHPGGEFAAESKTTSTSQL